MRFTLRQISVFVAVARHENVSRAAAELALNGFRAFRITPELRVEGLGGQVFYFP